MFWIIFSPVNIFSHVVPSAEEFMVLDSWFWMVSYIKASLSFRSICKSFQDMSFLDFHLGSTGHHGMKSKVLKSCSLYVNTLSQHLKLNPWWLFSKSLTLWVCAILSLRLNRIFSHLYQRFQHKSVTGQSRAALRHCQIVSAASSEGTDCKKKTSTKQFNKELCAAWGCTTVLFMEVMKHF